VISAQHPLADITAALIAKLRVSSLLSLALGGVVNELPQSPAVVTLPVVRVVVRGKPIGPIAGASIWDCEAEIDSFSDYAGDLQNFAIMSEVMALLNLQVLVVDGWTVPQLSLADPFDVEDEQVNGKKVKCKKSPFHMTVRAAA